MTAPFDPVDFSLASRDFPWDKGVNEGTLICPTCGCECNHPSGVDINRGGRITRIHGKDGPSEAQGFPAGRGSLIRVLFWCESGHTWARTFHFHKGTTSVIDHETGTYDDLSNPAEFWRD